MVQSSTCPFCTTGQKLQLCPLPAGILLDVDSNRLEGRHDEGEMVVDVDQLGTIEVVDSVRPGDI